MKVAIALKEKSKESKVSKVYGRCRYFAIYDTEKKSLDFKENPGYEQASGAGISATQFLDENKVEKIIAGNVGPKAEGALNSCGIEIELLTNKSLSDIIESL